MDPLDPSQDYEPLTRVFRPTSGSSRERQRLQIERAPATARETGSSDMDWSQLQYFPLALKHFSLLVLIFFLLVAWIEVRALRLAYMRMGLGPHAALLLLLVSLGGSYLNIPVAQPPAQQVMSGQEVDVFGMRYVIPLVVEWPGTVFAVNVGGAVIPTLLSFSLYIRNELWIRGLLAITGVAAVCHILAQP